ncbi:hypothetical protein COP2_035357 [Malus domestica]
MKSILPQKSVKPNLLSLIVTGIMSHMKYLGVLPPFGIRSRELRHTSWSCLLIRHMVNTPLSTNGSRRNYRRL